MKINMNKVKENGFEFSSEENTLEYIKRKLEFLESHNKNYTKEQYYIVCDLFSLVECIEMEE